MESLAQQLLVEESLADYNRQLDVLWFQSTRLQANLYLLGRIGEFPFDLFGDGVDLCWSLIADALYESSIMTIWRTCFDADGDALTITRLHDRVVTSAKDEKAKEMIADRLRTVQFHQIISEVKEHFGGLRNGWVAHLDQEIATKAQMENRGMPLIPLEKLKQVRDAIHALIEALSFESARGRTYPQYDEVVWKRGATDYRSDINQALDLIAATVRS